MKSKLIVCLLAIPLCLNIVGASRKKPAKKAVVQNKADQTYKREMFQALMQANVSEMQKLFDKGCSINMLVGKLPKASDGMLIAAIKYLADPEIIRRGLINKILVDEAMSDEGFGMYADILKTDPKKFAELIQRDAKLAEEKAAESVTEKEIKASLEQNMAKLVSIVQFLITKGIDLDMKDASKKTALDLAYQFNATPIIKMLTDSNAHTSAQLAAPKAKTK